MNNGSYFERHGETWCVFNNDDEFLAEFDNGEDAHAFSDGEEVSKPPLSYNALRCGQRCKGGLTSPVLKVRTSREEAT